MHEMGIPRSARALACAALIALAAPAAADDDHDHVTGFTTHGIGELSGVVTDQDGKPLAGVTVYIVAGSGAQQQVVTDAQGRYHAVLKEGGASTLVFVRGTVRLGGLISVPTRVEGGEAIEIHETVAPAVMPKPLASPSRIPEYSDAAKDQGVWARAWLLLDVDEHGAVTRLKLLGRPGHDLDRIAVRDALQLRFEPARDRAGRPTGTLFVWSYEWPSYWWMVQNRHSPGRVPEEAAKVPCKGSGGVHKFFRDCSQVDLARALSEPWIERPRP